VGDLRREKAVAAGDGMDASDEAFGLDAFEHEPGGAGAQGVEDVVVVLERGQDEDPGARHGGDDAPGRLDPVEHRHPYVHEHHVRGERGRPLNRLRAVGGLPDNVDRVVAW
jgi:hypothetical protein